MVILIGAKLAADHILLTGIEFIQFAESRPNIWPKVPGTIVVHVDSGKGIIQTVQERKSDGPLLDIKFSSETSIFQFTSAAFTAGYFANIKIQDALLDLLTAWMNRISKESASDIAKKTKRKTKKFFTESCTNEKEVKRRVGSNSKINNLTAEYTAQAKSLTPNKLDKEINEMRRKLQNANLNSKLHIRLTTFIDVRAKRPDCHPLGREIRVATTS